MTEAGQQVNGFSLLDLDGRERRIEKGPLLIVFFETDCPTCRLTLPFLNRLVEVTGHDSVVAISQDSLNETRSFKSSMGLSYPLLLDSNLEVTRAYDPLAVPTLFLLDRFGKIAGTSIGFSRVELNRLSASLCEQLGTRSVEVVTRFDGAPDTKPGCTSRHLEPDVKVAAAAALDAHARIGQRATRIELAPGIDPYDYCASAGFSDPLPVIPPTLERVERMLAAVDLSPEIIIGQVPPNYGDATVEKIAANAVMAGCEPKMMKMLLPLVRAACDERFNMHGVQATTHFAAPLIIVNGPVRHELGFTFRGNVFSNVARANSTLGRALQLILLNLGGAKPGEIDMSTLGNPGKFSYCIAENEEESDWDPLHVEMGLQKNDSAITLFAGEAPHGVSEHNARTGRGVLKTISRALATVWTYRQCAGFEALVALCPEHVKTLARDGFTKSSIRQFLFENTGIPVRHFEDEDPGEGVQFTKFYKKAIVDGEDCYLKFSDPAAIKIVVTGGTAGKFSAVVGSWAAGPRGSQMVTYPIPD